MFKIIANYINSCLEIDERKESSPPFSKIPRTNSRMSPTLFRSISSITIKTPERRPKSREEQKNKFYIFVSYICVFRLLRFTTWNDLGCIASS